MKLVCTKDMFVHSNFDSSYLCLLIFLSSRIYTPNVPSRVYILRPLLFARTFLQYLFYIFLPACMFTTIFIYNKPYGARRFGKYYNVRFDAKLVHGTCAIRFVTFKCTQCASLIYKPWYPGVSPHQQLFYQPVTDFT